MKKKKDSPNVWCFLSLKVPTKNAGWELFAPTLFSNKSMMYMLRLLEVFSCFHLLLFAPSLFLFILDQSSPFLSSPNPHILSYSFPTSSLSHSSIHSSICPDRPSALRRDRVTIRLICLPYQPAISLSLSFIIPPSLISAYLPCPCLSNYPSLSSWIGLGALPCFPLLTFSQLEYIV